MENLIIDIENIIAKVSQWQHLEQSTLNWKPSPEKWSVNECLEHLNRYANYYFPVLQNALTQQGKGEAKAIQYTWFGKFSIRSVHPDNQKAQKTLKHLNPNQSDLDDSTLREFLAFQNQFILAMKKGSKF